MAYTYATFLKVLYIIWHIAAPITKFKLKALDALHSELATHISY
jgi:hypothetical protein